LPDIALGGEGALLVFRRSTVDGWELRRMAHMESKVGSSKRKGRRESGFSMLELVISCAVIFVVMAMAMLAMQPSWQQFQATAAMDQVKTVLREARETAISQRRTVAVQFQNNNTIALYFYNINYPVGGGAPTQVIAGTPFLSVFVENSAQFMTFTGEQDVSLSGVADGYTGALTVPDGIYFEGADGGPPSGMMFQSDGTFTDGNGNVINGTVFIGVPRLPSTGRAVTILGSTGRVKAYRSVGAGWFL
jgi:type II secretory pathway pseudopilin PulG